MTNYIILAVILAAGMCWSTLAGKLTLKGAIGGGITGLAVFAGAGFNGLGMMAVFFLMGTVATSWKKAEKEKAGIAEESKKGRTAGQVFANAGVAGLLGMCVLIWPGQAALLRLMMAASFAAAAADTLSSELGNVYGSRYYNILTFRKDTRGMNGVVSLEGSLLGIAGSVVIACIYSLAYGWNAGVMYIVLGGTAGNLADSVLGATLERKHYLSNNSVNFLTTLMGALAAGAAAGAFRYH